MLYLESRSDAQRQQRTRQRLLRDVRTADSLGACIDALGPPSCTRELSMSCLVCTLLRVSDPRCLPCASPAVFNCFYHARAPWHGQAQTHAPTPRHCHGRPQSIAVPVRHWVRAWSACAHTTCVRAPPPPHNARTVQHCMKELRVRDGTRQFRSSCVRRVVWRRRPTLHVRRHDALHDSPKLPPEQQKLN